MLMQVRIGNACKSGLYVEFYTEDGLLLKEAMGDYYNAHISNQHIVFTPVFDEGDFILTGFGSNSRSGFTQGLCQVNKSTGSGPGPWAGLPAFELMDFELKEQDGKLIGLLPPDHLLPWPSKRSLATIEDKAAFCEEAVMVRCLSLVASGLTGFSSAMALPKHIRDAAPGAFMRSMKVARELNGN